MVFQVILIYIFTYLQDQSSKYIYIIKALASPLTPKNGTIL